MRTCPWGVAGLGLTSTWHCESGLGLGDASPTRCPRNPNRAGARGCSAQKTGHRRTMKPTFSNILGPDPVIGASGAARHSWALSHQLGYSAHLRGCRAQSSELFQLLLGFLHTGLSLCVDSGDPFPCLFGESLPLSDLDCDRHFLCFLLGTLETARKLSPISVKACSNLELQPPWCLDPS